MAETLREVIEAKVRALPVIDRTAPRLADEVLDALRSWEPSEAVLLAVDPHLPSKYAFRAMLDAAIKENDNA